MPFSGGNATPPAFDTGYQFAPEAGPPPDGYPQLPESADLARYGRIGKPGWTFRQTVLGTLITVVPWLVILIGSQLALPASGGAQHRLPVVVDLVGGIVAFVFTAVVEGAFLIAPIWFALRTRPPGTSIRFGLRSLGIRSTPWLPAVGWFAAGIAIMLVIVYPGYALFVQLFHLQLQTNVEAITREATYAPLTVAGTLAGAVLVAPFCEEIFFRGYLFAGLLSKMPVWVATIVSALLFTLVHGDIGSAIPLLAIGLILSVLRWKTGSLWPGIALHAFNNALATLTLLPVLLH